LFVLGAMMFLLAIGTSILAAASANIGANIRQNEFNRVMVLNDSVHRNIMYSLQVDPENQNLLGNQLAWLIYNTREDEEMDDIDLELGISAGSDLDIPDHMTVTITLSFLYRDVQITEGSDSIPEIPGFTDEDGNIIEPVPEVPGIPGTATIKAGMTVTVIIETDGLIRDESRLITTQAVYEYQGGKLTESPAAPPTMIFEPDGYGTWSMFSYEIIQSQMDN